MKFGLVPVAEAVGALAVHSERACGPTVKKGTLVSAEIAMQLKQAGVEMMIAARFEPGDIAGTKRPGGLPELLPETTCRRRSALYWPLQSHAEASGGLPIDLEALDGPTLSTRP